MFLYRLMFDLQANFNMVRCINMIYQTRLHIQSDCTVMSGKASHGGLLVGGYISSPLGARDHNSKEKGVDTVTVSSKTPSYLTDSANATTTRAVAA